MTLERREIKAGDLVTTTLDANKAVSNTYVVERKLEEECILTHPLAPECHLIKKDTELNVDFPTMQNNTEKCLSYAKKHFSYLGHIAAEDLKALCYYFVIQKDLTSKQRNDLANMCGKIASVVLSNNLGLAISIIKANRALLDDFNVSLFNNFSPIINDPQKIKTKHERYAIFNIAGFVLAQTTNS